VTGETVKLAWADQGYTGDNALQAAQTHGIDLQVVKLDEAKKGFVLLPRRWVVERSFGWLSRFRRLTRDYERLPSVLSGLHFLVFAILMLPRRHQDTGSSRKFITRSRCCGAELDCLRPAQCPPDHRWSA